MLKQLNIKSETVECLEIALITEEGKVFSSTYSVKENMELFNSCKSFTSDRFAFRSDNAKNGLVERKVIIRF